MDLNSLIAKTNKQPLAYEKKNYKKKNQNTMKVMGNKIKQLTQLDVNVKLIYMD